MTGSNHPELKVTRIFKDPLRRLLQTLLIACLPVSGLVAAELVPTDELTLNGRGTRQTMFVDLYTCELYLPAKTRNEQQIVSLSDRVRVKLQVHGTPPATLPDNWHSVLKRELTDRLFRRMQDQYRDLAEGDQVELDYLPGRERGCG